MKADEKKGLNSGFAFVALFLFAIAFYINTFFIAVDGSVTLGLSGTDIGKAIGAFAVGSILARLFVGPWLGGRIGFSLVVVAALGSIALQFLMMAPSTATVKIIERGIFGLTWATLGTHLFSTLASSGCDGRAVRSKVAVAMSLPLLALFFGQFLVDHDDSFGVPAPLVAVVLSIACLPLFLVTGMSGLSSKTCRKRRRFRFYPIDLQCASHLTIPSFLFTGLIALSGEASETIRTLAFPAYAVSVIASRQVLAAWLKDKHDSSVLFGSSLLILVGIAVSPLHFLGSGLTIVVSSALLGSGCGISMARSNGAIAASAPAEEKSQAMATSGLLGDLGMFFGPLVLSFAFESGGNSIAFGLILTLAVLLFSLSTLSHLFGNYRTGGLGS